MLTAYFYEWNCPDTGHKSKVKFTVNLHPYDFTTYQSSTRKYTRNSFYDTSSDVMISIHSISQSYSFTGKEEHVYINVLFFVCFLYHIGIFLDLYNLVTKRTIFLQFLTIVSLYPISI
jgi:hypothetical protein